MSSPLNILLVAAGSHGDVHPVIGLAQALKRRGHRPRVVTSAYFQELIEAAGIECIAVGTAEEFSSALDDSNMWHRFRSFEAVMEQVVHVAMRRTYDVLAELVEPGNTVLVATSLGLGARVAHDKLGVPLATLHLQPCIMRSVHQSSKYAGLYMPDWLPHFLKRWQYGLADKLLVERTMDKPVSAFRAELGLPAVQGIARDWIHSPQCVIGMFPDWFAPLQPDWPANTHLLGFPLYDESDVTPLPDGLQEFLAAGEPPIVFTPGTANRFAEKFFQTAVAACQMLGRRGLLLTRHAHQVPSNLPENVRHDEYVPLSWLLPGAAALVHHGGIGTMAQALAAGVPQLIMPLAHDQPDNAARIKRLGLGDAVQPSAFRPGRVAARLTDLMSDEQLAARCREAAERIAAARPLEEACRLIEALAPAKGDNQPASRTASSGTLEQPCLDS